jgi:hypothetical protein
MNYKSFSDWKLRMVICKLHVKNMYYISSAFVKRYFPLNYFFHAFRVEKMYKKNLEAEKQNAEWLKDRPWLIDSVADNVRERTWAEYMAGLRSEAYDAKEKAEEAERICNQTKLKLDQFMQFLIENVEEKQARAYAAQIPRLVDPDDISGTYERLCEFIDLTIKKHNA